MAKPTNKVVLWHNHVPERQNTTLYQGFVTRLKRMSPNMQAVDFISASLSDVAILLDGAKARIFDLTSGERLDDIAMHIFRNWQQQPALASSIAMIADATGIPYFDSQVGGAAPGKFTHHVAFWSQELNQPVTVLLPDASDIDRFLQHRDSQFTFPFVVKASVAQKGKDNFLVTNKRELAAAVQALRGRNVILQQFIENQGDWRVLTFGYKARYGIFRRGLNGSYLNNVSQGGNATETKLEDMDPAIISLAERAAAACRVEIAGVDIVPTEHGNYLLEVNYPPQLATGAFVEEKMAQFGAFIEEALSPRYPKKRLRGRARPVIGRHVFADIPQLHLTQMPAKVDTGAYTTSLSARDIHTETIEGIEVLCFETQDTNGEWHQHRTSDFNTKSVRNVHGWDMRYSLPVTVVIQGREVATDINLSDRSRMKYGLLLGRKLLRGNFVVNVELSQKEKS